MITTDLPSPRAHLFKVHRAGLFLPQSVAALTFSREILGLPQDFPRMIDRNSGSYLSHLGFYHFIKAQLILYRGSYTFIFSVDIFQDFIICRKLFSEIFIYFCLA
jgi:hypothetical protein